MLLAIFHLGFVFISLVVLVPLPFIPITRMFFRKAQWPTTIFIAGVVGCCVQVLTGLLWSHLGSRSPYGEIFIYGGICLGSLAYGLLKINSAEAFPIDSPERPHHLVLIIILVLAFTIRAIHPVEASYLGQSDAYTHLHYLHDIVEHGRLNNPVYSPGYHWILALPVLICLEDPYWVARFGGAFFGTGLVLGVYVFLRQLFGWRKALLGSFCAGCFPPMTLLMKTGVGTFANQLGLFLIPAIFYFYARYIQSTRKTPVEGYFLSLSLCGLAAVPMMLLHILIVFGMERIFMLLRAPSKEAGKTWGLILVFIPVIFLLIFHMNQVGPSLRFKTATILTEYSGKKQDVQMRVTEKLASWIPEGKFKLREKFNRYFQSPYGRLIIDYFSIKRIGFGNSLLNAMACVLLGIFFGVFTCGFVKKETRYVVIGLWGFVTSIQAGLGLMQFSSYQREGWSLLVAVCCLSGILVPWLFDTCATQPWLRSGIFILMSTSTLWTISHPPRHPEIHSSAEDEIVTAVRFFGQGRRSISQACPSPTDGLCRIADRLSGDLPLTLITRSFTGWSNQGEIPLSVLQRNSTLHVVAIKRQDLNDVFRPGRQYIVLVDRKRILAGRQLISAFSMVSPIMVKGTLKHQNDLFKINEKIIDHLNHLSKQNREVEFVALSPDLGVYIVSALTD